MFGLLRTTLALMVMVYHLCTEFLPFGRYAVFGFYIISGYLMTLIMHERYGYGSQGRRSYCLNRGLRLYPQYWAAALFSILLIVVWGADTTARFHQSLYWPSSMAEIARNILMVFPAWFPNALDPRLVPPAWALTVEIFFYILICLGLSKTPRRVAVWIFVSVCYVVLSYAAGWSWPTRYFTVPAASLPFSLGAAVYFASRSAACRASLERWRLSGAKLFVALLANALFWSALAVADIGDFVETGFYCNIVIATLLVFCLANGGKIFDIGKGADKKVGDYSYPVYLLHWQCGFLASWMIYGEAFHEFSFRGLVALAFSFVIVGVLSAFLIHCVDAPIEKLRSRIRPGGGPGTLGRLRPSAV